NDSECRQRDHFQQSLLIESSKVFYQVSGVDRARELRLTPHLIEPFNLAELFPGRGHQLLLLILNDSGSERCYCSVARIQIQVIQPAQHRGGRGRSLQRVSRCLPTTINRRSQQRVYANLLPGSPWNLQYSLELVLKGCSRRVGPRGNRGVEQAQSTLKLQTRANGDMNNEPGLADVH